jgi:hypothetical protein
VTADPDRPAARLRALVLDPRTHEVLLIACAALILFARAGALPLANYDDAYYAEKAKQMLRTGDWLTPRFAGVERLDNAPLFLWLMAGSFAVLGVNAFAAVLWSALAGVACVFLTYRLAQRLGFDVFESWVSGIVLLGTGYFLKYANHAMFDVFMTGLFLMALLAYRRAWEGERLAWVAVGALTGLGVLTKSALGLFPFAVIALHVTWSRRVRRAWQTGAWWAPLTVFAVIAPWYGHQLLTHREAFLREHVAWLLVERGVAARLRARAAAHVLAVAAGGGVWPVARRARVVRAGDRVHVRERATAGVETARQRTAAARVARGRARGAVGRTRAEALVRDERVPGAGTLRRPCTRNVAHARTPARACGAGRVCLHGRGGRAPRAHAGRDAAAEAARHPGARRGGAGQCRRR